MANVIRVFSTFVILSLVLLSALFLLTGVTITVDSVFGANITNVSVKSKVYIWNTEPTLYNVEISPSPIDLTPGNITIVNCTAYFWDYNGWDDVANGTVNATLYDISNGYVWSDDDDNNNHYSNTSCTLCSEIPNSDGMNGTCTCFFPVWYYANNGTWQCNITIKDSGGNASERAYNLSAVSGIANATMNTVLGINVPSIIDFGNLSVTELSADIQANITNWGNVRINVSLRGFGGTDESLNGAGNYSMLCEYGNISIDYMRHSMGFGIDYDGMTNLTYTWSKIENLTINTRVDDTSYTDSSNATYWKIYVPLSVGGQCNGTLIFSAIDAS